MIGSGSRADAHMLPKSNLSADSGVPVKKQRCAPILEDALAKIIVQGTKTVNGSRYVELCLLHMG